MAILLASINVFGGFAVTRRMLGMFRRADPMTATIRRRPRPTSSPALLFILSLAGLSKHETAKAGNGFGIAGMAIALAATIGLATRSITADRPHPARRRHGRSAPRSACGGPARSR